MLCIFLYGSLVEPSLMRHMLNLTERTRLWPASIFG